VLIPPPRSTVHGAYAEAIERSSAADPQLALAV